MVLASLLLCSYVSEQILKEKLGSPAIMLMPKRKSRTQPGAKGTSDGRHDKPVALSSIPLKKQRRSPRNQDAAGTGTKDQYKKLQLQDLPDNVFVQILRQLGLQRLSAMRGMLSRLGQTSVNKQQGSPNHSFGSTVLTSAFTAAAQADRS